MATAYTAIAADATSGTVRSRPIDARKVIAPAGRRARSDAMAPMRDAVVPARRVRHDRARPVMIVRARSVTIQAGASTATPSPTGGPNVREGETRQLATSPGGALIADTGDGPAASVASAGTAMSEAVVRREAPVPAGPGVRHAPNVNRAPSNRSCPPVSPARSWTATSSTSSAG